jgi:hypothetical protein
MKHEALHNLTIVAALDKADAVSVLVLLMLDEREHVSGLI